MNTTTREDMLPLTPHVLHILLALRERPSHGYELRRQIREDSGGAVIPDKGSLYKALHRLEYWRWIRRVESGSGAQQCYAITSTGESVLRVELDRYEKVVGLGRERADRLRIAGGIRYNRQYE